MNSKQTSKVENIDTDIVVIGSGGCGMPAATAAAEKGAKVTVLEKAGVFGGASLFAFGLFAADSLAQRRLDIDLPKDRAFRVAMDWAHWKINGRIERAFIDKSGDTIKWLEDKGLKFDIVGRTYTYFPESLRGYHCLRDKRTGSEINKVLRKNCEDMSVQMFPHCRAKKILTNDRGEVTGVLATMKETELKINTKSVIIATGGFGGDKELLKKYYPVSQGLSFSGPPQLTGDGFLMAKEIGAASEGLGNLSLSVQTYRVVHKFSNLNAITKSPRTVWVNKNGERYCSEWLADHANALVKQPDKIMYCLFDEKFKNMFIGEERHIANFLGSGDKFYYHAVTKPKLPLNEDIASEVAKGGGVKIAGSWSEIAEWMGIAPEVLEATIEEYNAACDQGYDPIFNKERMFLDAMRTPPYYAIRCHQDFHSTFGGIKINHRMEVLNELGKPIPGLYAGGDITGGWMSDTYCIKLSGHAFGFALNSGRIAGENAVKYVMGK